MMVEWASSNVGIRGHFRLFPGGSGMEFSAFLDFRIFLYLSKACLLNVPFHIRRKSAETGTSDSQRVKCQLNSCLFGRRVHFLASGTFPKILIVFFVFQLLRSEGVALFKCRFQVASSV